MSSAPDTANASAAAPSTGTLPAVPLIGRWQRVVVGLVTATYLGFMGIHLYWFLLADYSTTPVSYLFTWDMFPSFRTESMRWVAVGRTAEGEHVRVYPGPWQRLTFGRVGVHTRADMLRNPTNVARIIDADLGRYHRQLGLTPQPAPRASASGAVAEPTTLATAIPQASPAASEPAEASARRIEHVWLFQQYWPVKNNIPPALFKAWWGREPSGHKSWRLVDEFDYDHEGAGFEDRVQRIHVSTPANPVPPPNERHAPGITG